jgi:hypothetical protein
LRRSCRPRPGTPRRPPERLPAQGRGIPPRPTPWCGVLGVLGPFPAGIACPPDGDTRQRGNHHLPVGINRGPGGETKKRLAPNMANTTRKRAAFRPAPALVALSRWGGRGRRCFSGTRGQNPPEDATDFPILPAYDSVGPIPRTPCAASWRLPGPETWESIDRTPAARPGEPWGLS